MRRFSALAIIFLALCTVCILLMRSCGGERKEEVAATLPPAEEILATAVPENSPAPTPAPTPVPTPSVEGSVWTTSDVNLRRAPGTDGEIITAVDKGVELQRVGMAENGWSKILYQGDITCYVNSDYLTDVDPATVPTATGTTAAPGNAGSPASSESGASGFSVTPLSDTVWTLDGMNLRRGPGTDYDVAATVDKNTQLQRTGVTADGWSRVLYNSVGYYVSSEYLTTVKPEDITEEEKDEETGNAVPADRTFETQGEFRSDTGVPLNIIVRWSVMDRKDGSKSLTLSASLSSCTLHATSFADNLCFKVGNDTFNLTTPDINVDSTALTETPLGNCTAEVTQFNVPVKVIWHFNGTYSEKQLGDITAATTLTLG